MALTSDHDAEILAAVMGCRGLEDLCLKKMGAFESRVRKEYIRWKEVLKRNEDNNETILVMDGMVYDVTRWLPEHPVGNTIIPSSCGSSLKMTWSAAAATTPTTTTRRNRHTATTATTATTASDFQENA